MLFQEGQSLRAVFGFQYVQALFLQRSDGLHPNGGFVLHSQNSLLNFG